VADYSDRNLYVNKKGVKDAYEFIPPFLKFGSFYLRRVSIGNAWYRHPAASTDKDNTMAPIAMLKLRHLPKSPGHHRGGKLGFVGGFKVYPTSEVIDDEEIDDIILAMCGIHTKPWTHRRTQIPPKSSRALKGKFFE